MSTMIATKDSYIPTPAVINLYIDISFSSWTTIPGKKKSKYITRGLSNV